MGFLKNGDQLILKLIDNDHVSEFGNPRAVCTAGNGNTVPNITMNANDNNDNN